MLAKATERSEGRSQRPAVESGSRPLARQFALFNAKFSIFNPSWSQIRQEMVWKNDLWRMELKTRNPKPETFTRRTFGGRNAEPQHGVQPSKAQYNPVQPLLLFIFSKMEPKTRNRNAPIRPYTTSSTTQLSPVKVNATKYDQNNILSSLFFCEPTIRHWSLSSVGIHPISAMCQQAIIDPGLSPEQHLVAIHHHLNRCPADAGT